MPFLRRRHTPSESDLKRLHNKTSASHSHDDAASIPPVPPVPPVPTVPLVPSSLSPSQSLPSEQYSVDSSADGNLAINIQSRASSASQRRPGTPPVQEQSNKHKRFSVLRFRNASDSQLSLRARQQAEKPPPIPRPPEIITTAPTGELSVPKKKSSRLNLASLRRPNLQTSEAQSAFNGNNVQPPPLKSSMRKVSTDERSSRPSLSPLEEPLTSPRVSTSTSAAAGSNTPSSTPATLVNRPSESSRSDASSHDRTMTQGPQSPQSPQSTPKKSPHGTPFFKMRRAKKSPEPLFPLSHLPQKDKDKPGLPTTSLTSPGMGSTARPSSVHSAKMALSHMERGDINKSPASVLFAPNGSRSGQSSPTRPQFLRERSNTQSTTGRNSTDEHLHPSNTRNSSSINRKSFVDLLGLSRRRQTSEFGRQGTLTPSTPASLTSKSNSLQLPRGSVSTALPERREDESPAKYLARVEEELSRGVIAAALSKNSDPFSAAVLRSYMRSFGFFGDPMDMAIRKLLMEAELPKETQQIDRFLQAFANRYDECNPGIYTSPEQAYFIAFSLLILHTDVFNKNNKYKMQKPDYLKNTQEEGIYDDILECFYDNITYTPFIHVEDEPDVRGDRTRLTKPRSKLGDPARRAQKEPIDPYTLILDNNLDALRPNLKEAMQINEHYSYLGTATSLNLKDLRKTFFRTGVLQIISARSRPDAFRDEKTTTNPEDARAGIVDIKVTKVGLLWRKDTKKRKTRSPWQEWGAILTGAQLYFFRNTTWIKNLMNQYESHIRSGHDGVPIIFRPPLEEFKPDVLMSTDGAVALHSTEYKKHKNAFVYMRSGKMDEILLADNEDEMNDWLAKLNYAAAFKTSGVRIRGVGGAGGSSQHDSAGRWGLKQPDESEGASSTDHTTSEVPISNAAPEHKMAKEIQSARRDIMQQKIALSEEKIQAAQKQLEIQLRNARHLQILAPIQPRTREHLLEAAARISAQLKWTRMEMWKEKCHRDILQLDHEEEFPAPGSDATPVKSDQSHLHERESSPTPRPTRTQSKLKKAIHRLSRTPADAQLDHATKPDETEQKTEQLSDEIPSAPVPGMNDAKITSPVDHDSLSRSNSVIAPHESTPSVASHPVKSPAKGSHRRSQSRENVGLYTTTSKPRDSDDHDDFDTEERAFLRDTGLLESRLQEDFSDKMSGSGPGDLDHDKLDKTKVRRSLHRTLREGAGHLSHHRSKKGRDAALSGSIEDTRQDGQLSRGSGSFTVHGKKASVINFGTGLDNMSTEEKIRARKQSVAAERPLSPALSTGDDDDFYSAVGDLSEDQQLPDEQDACDGSRRGSVASESTATARSFRELHRKYSSAQAARAVSGGSRLLMPSDADSDAVSFSDGRRSPLPSVGNGDMEEEDEGKANLLGDNEVTLEVSTSDLKGTRDQSVSTSKSNPDEDAKEPEGEGTVKQSEQLEGLTVQTVNA